jgi:hypothetical protein
MEGAIILDQLGGNEFMLMTGSTRPVVCGRSQDHPNPFAQVIIGEHEAGWEKLRVTLMPNDCYKMEFFKGLLAADEADITTETFEDVDAESLAEIFTQVTGMDTVMPVIRHASQH